MIRFYEAGIKEIDELMELRKTMLREVNSLPDDYVFSKAFRRDSKKIFLSGNQTTFIAAEDKLIACATICYFDVLPTIAHPGGKRAHIMNVYTAKEYRRQGIMSELIGMSLRNIPADCPQVEAVVADASNHVIRILMEQYGFEDAVAGERRLWKQP